MRCLNCEDVETRACETVITLEGESSKIIIEDVPAMACDLCGEYFLTPEVSAAVRILAERANDLGEGEHKVSFLDLTN